MEVLSADIKAKVNLKRARNLVAHAATAPKDNNASADPVLPGEEEEETEEEVLAELEEVLDVAAAGDRGKFPAGSILFKIRGFVAKAC